MFYDKRIIVDFSTLQIKSFLHNFALNIIFTHNGAYKFCNKKELRVHQQNPIRNLYCKLMAILTLTNKICPTNNTQERVFTPPPVFNEKRSRYM